VSCNNIQSTQLSYHLALSQIFIIVVHMTTKYSVKYSMLMHSQYLVAQSVLSKSANCMLSPRLTVTECTLLSMTLQKLSSTICKRVSVVLCSPILPCEKLLVYRWSDLRDTLLLCRRCMLAENSSDSVQLCDGHGVGEGRERRKV